MSVDDVVARVRAYRDHMRWSNNQLAKQANVSEAAVRNIDKPTWNCRLSTLRALEAVVLDGFAHPRNDATVPHIQG